MGKKSEKGICGEDGSVEHSTNPGGKLPEALLGSGVTFLAFAFTSL